MAKLPFPRICLLLWSFASTLLFCIMLYGKRFSIAAAEKKVHGVSTIKSKSLPLKTKNKQKDENRRLGFIKSLHMQQSSLFVCLFVLGLTSLSTIFQSYRDGVCMWQGAQCSLLECCSLKYHTPDTLT